MTINISEVVTTTLRKRSRKLADNTLNHNALLRMLQKKDKVELIGGGRVITESIMYGDNSTVDWYEDYEVIDTGIQNVIDASEWDWKQLAGTVSMSGLESLKNSGKEAFINWLQGRIQNLEKSMQNKVSTDVYNNGSNAKALDGLRVHINDAPGSATVGGISDAANVFWRNQVQADQASVTSSNIRGEMNKLWLKCIRGTDKPHMIAYDANFYEAFESSLQDLQRFQRSDAATAGFEELAYKTASVIYDDQCPTSRGYFINCDYLKLKIHKDRNFVQLGTKRESVNQDAFVQLFGFAGNLVSSNRALQGVLKPS